MHLNLMTQTYWWWLQRKGNIYSFLFNNHLLSSLYVAGTTLDTSDLEKESKRWWVTWNSMNIWSSSLSRFSFMICVNFHHGLGYTWLYMVLAILSNSFLLLFHLCFGSWAAPFLCIHLHRWPPTAKPSLPGIYCVWRRVCKSHFCDEEHSDW